MCIVHTCVYDIYSTYRTQDFVVKKNKTHFTVCQNWSDRTRSLRTPHTWRL